jgi:hypothetical protein
MLSVADNYQGGGNAGEAKEKLSDAARNGRSERDHQQHFRELEAELEARLRELGAVQPLTTASDGVPYGAVETGLIRSIVQKRC